jgi:hypothetical protein
MSDVHDDWTDLLDRLRPFKGQFQVDQLGRVRHKIERCYTLFRGETTPEFQCPLNALRRVAIEQLGQPIEPLENGDFRDMATILDMPMEYVERFATAADGDELAPEDESLRERIIETVC